MTLPNTSNVARPQAEGYHALLTYGNDYIDNLYLQLYPTPDNPIQRATMPAQQSPTFEINPEDYRPESGRIFSRSRFSGGEGLDRAHVPGMTELDTSRFWDSRHIEINIPRPGRVEELKLAKATEEISGTTAATPYAARVPDGTRLFWADGAEVHTTANILAATPSITAQNPGTLSGEGSQTITGVAVLGAVCYAALNGAGSIHKRSSAGTWTTWSDLQANKIWAAKGRIMASDANILYEAAAGADSDQLKSVGVDETWTMVIDAGHVLLCAATNGTVYAYAEETGTLILRGESPMRPGEVVYDMVYADGLVFVGIGDENVAGGKIGRLYIFQLSGARLVGGSLVREWGTESSTVDHTPTGMAVSRDEVLIPVLDDDGKAAVFCYFLPNAGFYRRIYFNEAPKPRQVFEFDDRVVIFRDGDTVLRQSGTVYETEGYWISPYADWYSTAQKAIVGLRIESVEIPAVGAEIGIYYATDPDAILDSTSSLWKLAKTLKLSRDRILEDEVPLSEVIGRGVAVMLKLTASTAGTATPKVRAVSARAFDDLEDVAIQVPVNISDILERPGKGPIRVPGRGLEVYAALRGREGQPAQLEMLRSRERIRGRVEKVTMSTPVHAPRGPAMLVANLQVRGVKMP
jgi:hypothetical protein